ncbi:MAG TPA: HAMP domain-containing sensor histidine kinase [Vicinamibacterales bacterium]|nr:HAMP domain-containing sensor histidine kinase [Vicinamibacterales bacterium]
MSDPVWYRSLYWRFAIGFVALLATLLVLQGAVFLWMTGRMPDLFPSRSPAQFAAAIAEDLSATLATRPETDLETHLYEAYHRAFHSYVVVMRDGRTIISRHIPPTPDLARRARGQLFGEPVRERGPGPPMPGGSPGRPESPFPPPEGGRRGFPRGGPGPGPQNPSRAEFAPIVVNGEPVGLVAVPSQPPPLRLVFRNLGPTLTGVAMALLVAGTAVAALLVFRPTHKRLRSLQHTVTALGRGQWSVRAPTTGGDEVASLARAFNDMADKLEERTAALADADRTRRQLLADVSHELNTPLAAIRGYVETLQMTDLDLDDDTRRRYLGIVREETERLEHIIGDLLDLARLEGGGGTLKTETVDVSHLFARLRNRHGRELEDQQIRFETIASPEAATVAGDANRLEQALQNLVANAIRHTPAGGEIRVEALHAGDAIRLTVEDTGPGIPVDHLPHLFDRFYKADASRSGTTLPSGSGLGLSIVQAIVARHGGTIAATNRSEGGARFEILLPAGSRGAEPVLSGPTMSPGRDR